MNDNNKINSILLNIPSNPGVYLMKANDGEIIYIGKASSLKKRVSSYFKNKNHDPKTRVLVKNIADIEYIITDSEIEALILESNLIKKEKPKFNVRLKDDKRYPYIAVTLNENYPRIIYTRKIYKKGDRYFGPYTDAKAAKNIVSMINSIFKLKTCKRDLPLKKDERPCLNYQMKRCNGQCTGKISREEYLSLISTAIKFLEGNIEPVLENLQSLMKKHSDEFEYEKAAQIRNIIYDIQNVFESQKVYIPIGQDQDYISVSIFGSEAILVLFEFRKGILLGRKISLFKNTEYSDTKEIIKSFILDYYKRSEIPQKIITSEIISDKDIIETFLTKKSSRKVLISPPVTGDDKGIINMIHKNIDVIHSDRVASLNYTNREKGLEELKIILNLKNTLTTIECFDISNFHGSDAVASMVCFNDGLPDKSNYRRYKIKGYDSPNDPGMIHEVVARRVQYLVNEDIDLPDLMVIDGGKAQLSRAIEAANNFDISINIISIAKRFEEIYFNLEENPLQLTKDSPALKIIQNIRDEAHRFAITYHRKLRDKKTNKSELDNITDIGEKTKELLLEHFGSIEKIKNTNIDELKRVPGIGDKTAEKIHSYFNGE